VVPGRDRGGVAGCFLVGDFVDGVVCSYPVGDFYSDGVSGAGLVYGPVVDLHRLDGHFKVGGVAPDADSVADFERCRQLDSGDYRMGEEIRYRSDFLLGHFLSFPTLSASRR